MPRYASYREEAAVGCLCRGSSNSRRCWPPFGRPAAGWCRLFRTKARSKRFSWSRRTKGHEMQSLLVVAHNTFRETVRDKILYNLVFFALLLIGASVLLGTLTIGEQSRIINDIGLAAIN